MLMISIELKAASLLLFVFSLLGCQSEITYESTGNDVTVLKGATLYDGNGNKIENATIILKDGKIEAIGENITVYGQADVIDLHGKYITPGLVDAHVHFGQTAFFDSRPDALDLRDTLDYSELQDYLKNNPEPFYEAYLRSGITAVYDVGGFSWTISRQDSAENNLDAPHVAAAGILITPVGPERLAFFRTKSDSMMSHLGSEDVGRAVVKQNTELGSTGIKLWSLRPNDSAFVRKVRTVKEEAEKLGNEIIVHATTLEQAKLALDLNATLLVHSVTDTIVDEQFINRLVESNTIYTPTLIVSRGYMNTYNAVIGAESFKITDPNQVVDEKTRQLLNNAEVFKKYTDSSAIANRMERFDRYLKKEDSIMAINLKKLYEAGATIVVGTDAGNPGTLHGISMFDEMEAFQKAGIPAEDIIVMATKNGALAMQRSDDFGTLEKGKLADLIILEKDPVKDISNMRSLTHVMRGGLLRPVNKNF